MLTMLGIASAVITGLTVAAVVMIGAVMAKMLFFVVTLPFRVVFGLLFFPLWLVKSVLRLAAAVVFIPLMLVLGVVGIVVAAVVALAAILVPLIPLLLVGLLLWAVFRSFRPAVA